MFCLASLPHHPCTGIYGNVSDGGCLHFSHDMPSQCLQLEYLWVLSHMENILSKMQPKWSSIMEQSNSYNVGHFCFLDFSFQNIVTTFAELVKNNQHADVVCINTEKLNRRNSTR